MSKQRIGGHEEDIEIEVEVKDKSSPWLDDVWLEFASQPHYLYKFQRNFMPSQLKEGVSREVDVRVLEARIEALEFALVIDGRWSNDSEIGIIQMSSVESDRLIANELVRLNGLRKQKGSN